MGRRSQELAREAGHEMAREADMRARRAAGHLGSVSEALRSAADTLQRDGEERLADYARRANERLGRSKEYLEARDPRAMADDLERSAREHPGVFLGGAFAAGFAAGRFLRASEPQEELGIDLGDEPMGAGEAMVQDGLTQGVVT